MTESQATLLEALAVHGPMPVGALARHVDLAQPTVTRALKTPNVLEWWAIKETSPR